MLTRRVCVSSGALGSTELLMRCRDVHGTLPHVSPTLGQRFSANGDFLSFAVAGDKPVDPNYGPVITRMTDYNLFDKFDRERAFILEDAAFPAFASWYVEGALPVTTLGSLWKAIGHAFHRLLGGASLGRVGFFLADLLRGDVSSRTAVLLCMGLDKGTGAMKLNDNGFLELDWPYRDNMKLYDAILAMAKDFGRYIGARLVVALPTWWWPARHNVTVHALGGCILADDAKRGVTSGAVQTLGQVFGYQGLYVADGSIVPTAVGANPTATITALSEMVAEGITGLRPDADL